MQSVRNIRPWLAGFLVLVAIASGVGLWAHRRDQGLPSHQGRSVRNWFADFCRASVLGDQLSPERRELRHQESLLAMLSMGTSAVPFLVDQAFLMEPVSALHSNLFGLFQFVPEAAGGGSFMPPGRQSELAAGMLQELRPEPSVLLPLLQNRFATSETIPRRQSIYLAGAFATVPPEVSDWLSGVITNPEEETWTRVLAFQSLVWLGGKASNALPAVLGHLQSAASNQPNPNLVRWLGSVGPAASAALPWIEHALSSTNLWQRYHAAIALHAISPGHPAAREALRNGLEGADSSRSMLMGALAHAPRHPIPVLEEGVTAGAAAEIAAWDERGASFGWCNVLDRIAPRRASEIYRQNLRATRLPYAAGRLLALERTNREAARVLMELSRQPTPGPVRSIPWLRETDSSNQEVLSFLNTLATGKPGIPRDEARLALVLIRIRELQRARGLGDPRDR